MNPFTRPAPTPALPSLPRAPVNDRDKITLDASPLRPPSFARRPAPRRTNPEDADPSERRRDDSRFEASSAPLPRGDRRTVRNGWFRKEKRIASRRSFVRSRVPARSKRSRRCPKPSYRVRACSGRIVAWFSRGVPTRGTFVVVMDEITISRVQSAPDVPLARGFSGGDDVRRRDRIVVLGVLGIDE